MEDVDQSAKVKLSQNIQALIGEIGEKQVLLQLAIRTHRTSWQVFHNIGEAGYDILMLNADTGERLRIEVKTRQRLYTTGKPRRRVNYFLTDGEYKACDYLVAYFIDNNGFYVIPKSELKPTVVNGKTRWRYTLPSNQLGEDQPGRNKYLNAWNTLLPDFDK